MPATKPKSRPARWSAALADALEILSEMEEMRARLESAIEDVKEVQSEFQEWRDNLPESLTASPLGEKLDAVTELDLGVLDSALDFDAVRSALEEAESADLPLGFGRD